MSQPLPVPRNANDSKSERDSTAAASAASATSCGNAGGNAGGNGSAGHGCTRRGVLLRGAGIAAAAAGIEFGLAACGGSGITVPIADVPVGGGKILTDAYYVVTQPTDGQYRAFINTCPHASCAVNAIRDGQIICDCHGSRFSLDDGSVIKGPASKGLGKANVTVSGDTLTVTA